jgi:cytochrome c oxidase subunit 2
VRKRPIAQAVVLGVVASAIGIALALWINWFPTNAATQDGPIDTLYDVLMIVSVPIFVLVVGVILFSVWQFRMRPGQEKQDGPPIHGNTRLEVFWTAIPAVILISLSSYAYAVLHHVEKKKPNELQVNVTGQQFAWSFAYPQPGGRSVSSGMLYLPEGRPVIFHIRSRDVIHSFWVPAFRMKTDTVPGIVTHLRITPTKLGSYPVVCAELCGLGHATMRATVNVVTPARFDSWLSTQRSAAGGGAATAGGAAAGGTSTTPAAGGAGDAALGRATFTGAGGCAACHTLADAGASGTVGPDLDRVLRGQTADQIRTSIVRPNAAIAQGYRPGVMPQTFGQTLSSAQIDGLVAYLSTVTK